MHNDLLKISDAEMEIMRIIWDRGIPITSNEIFTKQPKDKQWKISTILTLTSRLMQKRVLSSFKKGRVHYFYPLVTETEYKKSQAKKFIENMYEGSAKKFISTLYDGEDIDKDELAELRSWFLKRW